MALIKCSECSKEISDAAPACIGCGAPMAVAATKPDNVGKFGLHNLKLTVSSITTKVKEKAEAATEQGKVLMKSRQQKDADAVERMAEDFKKATPQSQLASDKSCARFKSALESTIDIKFAEIMHSKSDTDKFLTFVDSQILTTSVRNVFKHVIDAVPPQVEAACKLSEAILAPSALEREQLVKGAVGISGGAAGIGMIIAGIGSALGWGAGIIASVSAFFAGTSIAGPAGWAIAGITLAGIAAYFATTSSEAKNTERFLTVLKSSAICAVDAIWPEYEAALIKVLDSEFAS